MKSNVSANKSSFKTHKSHTPEEVFAAGGTTAFGLKMGKNNETLIKALESLPLNQRAFYERGMGTT